MDAETIIGNKKPGQEAGFFIAVNEVVFTATNPMQSFAVVDLRSMDVNRSVPVVIAILQSVHGDSMHERLKMVSR